MPIPTPGLRNGETWVSAKNCRFENNTTGFHFKAVSGTATYYTYTGNEFLNNGTDIDNRCGQSVDISKAIFE